MRTVVKIRISGTKEECREAVQVIKISGVVREESTFYPNRGTSLLGRVYLEVEFSGEIMPAYKELPSGEE